MVQNRQSVRAAGIVVLMLAAALAAADLYASASMANTNTPGPNNIFAAATYSWTSGANDNDYQNPINWTPIRTTPAPDDILVINNGLQDNLSNLPNPGQTIGQLKILNNSNVTLQTQGPHAALPGTISRSGNTVTGVGTLFTTQLSVGDVIMIQSGGNLIGFDVTAITSDTSLTTLQSGTLDPQVYANASRLTISGGPGDDLIVGPGSRLDISGPAADKAIRIALLPGTTGNISGNMSFTGVLPPDGTFNRLTAADANAVTFQNGSAFTNNSSVSGFPFGSNNLNSIVFTAGSTYTAIGGASPFAAQQPASVVVFQHGSLYIHRSNGNPSFNGRTYGNFQFDFGNFSQDVSFAPLVMDNLTVTNGSLEILYGGGFNHQINGNLTVNGGTLNIGSGSVAGDTVSIKGNIAANGGGGLNFNPTSAGTVSLNGPTSQTINGTGPLNFGALQNVVVDDPGVTLGRAVTLGGALALTNGIVTTGTNVLNVVLTGTVTRTNGYVNGNLQKFFSVPASKTFEVGTANGYSPVDVSATTVPSGGTPFAVRAVQGAHPSIPNPGSALSRYWSLTFQSTITADLTFHYLSDAVDIPSTANESNFALTRFTGGTFSQPGGSVNTAANTASIAGVSSSADWTLAEPVALATGNATLSGQVLGADNRALRSATVVLTDSNGVKQFTTSSSLGFYTFGPLSTGQSYTLTALSKRYRFRTVTVQMTGDMTVNLTGLE